MKANVQSIDSELHICYDLPHSVRTSKVYPLRAPNGSTIIIYGHEYGLRLVWRGGRPFKHDPQKAPGKPEPNGASHDTVMILDSSDEETQQETAIEEESLFQDEEIEYDPSQPYESIVQTLDLPLGIEVLRLSFPPLHPDIHESSLPPVINKNVVIAIACSDLSIRILSVPLKPISPKAKSKAELKNSVSSLTAGRSLFGEQMIILSTGTTHQSIPKGVSISVTASLPEDPEDMETEDGDRGITSRHSSRHPSRSRSVSRRGKDQLWDLLVASHSADLSGLLLIHRIPIMDHGAHISDEMHVPWRKQYLASPAVAVEFSSALYPASRHSQLLIAEAKGSVRLYDCLPNSTVAQGSWLASFYTDFETPQNSLARRKAVLDAQWILGGKAVLVLQADGKWGIWDYEGRGPIPSQTAASATSKSGGCLTSFALEGWVGASSKSQPLLKASNAKNDSRSKLAPMTPSTRKMKQDALFTGPSNVSDRPARGGLCVAPLPDTLSTRPDDESVLLWHNTTAVVIPSLFTYWQNKIRGSGNLFGSGAKGEPKVISNIRLGGEICNGMSLIPNTQPTKSRKDTSDQIPILVTGEKRLLIITPPLIGPEKRETASPQVVPSTLDQQLLAKGELDVNGMDRILAGMSNDITPRPKSQPSNGQNLLSI